METTLAPLGGLTEDDLGRWRELAAAAAEPNPFYEPLYLLPLAGALSERDEVELLVVAENGEWRACMPVRRAGRWHRIPLPSLAGWRGSGLLPALLGTPLVHREHLASATTALLRAGARAPGSYFFVLDSFAAGGPVHGAIEDALVSERLWSHVFSEDERAFMRRREQNDYLTVRFQRKHLRYLRGQARRLCESLGGELEIVDRAGAPRAVEELIELEAASRLAARGEVIAADPRIVSFFGEMCAAFAADDRLQLLALRAGGRTVAIKCNLLADPGVFYLKIAFDESLRAFSPGIQMEAAALDLFHARPRSDWIDSCALPGNETFNRLLPERRRLLTVALAPRTARTLLAAPAIRLVGRLRDRAMGREPRQDAGEPVPGREA